MEKAKVKKTRALKRKKRRRKSVWQKILEKDLQLNELTLFNETIHSRMVQEAYILERKRNPRDYVA